MGRTKTDKKKGLRKDGRYEHKGVIGKDMSGKKIYQSFYSDISLDEAKNKYADYLVEQRVAKLTGTVFPDKNITGFKDWGEIYLHTYKEPNVAEETFNSSYRNPFYVHLLPFFANADLNSIMPVDIQNFWLTQKNCSESVQNKIRMVLNGIFDSAIENGRCRINPARSKLVNITSDKEKKPIRVLNEEQIQYVITQTKLKEIKMLLGSGARRGEVCGFQWPDYVQGQGIYVNRSIAIVKGGGIKINPPKWKSYRFIPLDNQTCHMLDQMPRTSIFIFPNKLNAPQNPNTFYQKVQRNLNELLPELPNLRTHELRHTFGTHLKRLGVDTYVIQKIMGHKDIKMTTETYLHEDKEMMIKALKEVSSNYC